MYCSNLTTVKLLDSITYIATQSFYSCTSLTSIYITKANGVVTLDAIDAFSNIGHQVTIHVPSNLISSYQTASNWVTLYNNGDVTFVAIS